MIGGVPAVQNDGDVRPKLCDDIEGSCESRLEADTEDLREMGNSPHRRHSRNSNKASSWCSGSMLMATAVAAMMTEPIWWATATGESSARKMSSKRYMATKI